MQEQGIHQLMGIWQEGNVTVPVLLDTPSCTSLLLWGFPEVSLPSCNIRKTKPGAFLSLELLLLLAPNLVWAGEGGEKSSRCGGREEEEAAAELCSFPA